MANTEITVFSTPSHAGRRVTDVETTVFGWKGDALQKAMDANCFGATCSALKTQSFTEANKCSVKDSVKENIEGCKWTLPPVDSQWRLIVDSLP